MLAEDYAVNKNLILGLKNNEKGAKKRLSTVNVIRYEIRGTKYDSVSTDCVVLLIIGRPATRVRSTIYEVRSLVSDSKLTSYLVFRTSYFLHNYSYRREFTGLAAAALID